MKVVCDEAVLDAQVAFGGEGVDELVLLPATEITAKTIEGADALVVRSTIQVDQALLRHHTPGFIGTATVGCDHIDLALLDERNCHFLSAQGSSAPSVAQFTWALIVHLLEEQTRPLSSYRLGVIGCGAIGERVARCGEYLGLEVQRLDPPLQHKHLSDRYVDRLSDCDLISFHVPLTLGGDWPTIGMIDSAWLATLPRHSRVVNTARGQLVAPEALLAARAEKRIEGLALDVFPSEPAVDPKLLQACGLATPHVAGRSLEGMRANTAAIAQAFRSHFKLGAFQPPSLPAAPNIQVTESDSLSNFVTKAWNLGAQDRLMKESMVGSAEDRSSAFRQLRRPPYRRDLVSYRIDGTPSDELRLFIDALRTTTNPIDQGP